jgi:hypothetical protein
MQNSGKPEFCGHPSKSNESSKGMGCRVKPGNDGGARTRGTALRCVARNMIEVNAAKGR